MISWLIFKVETKVMKQQFISYFRFDFLFIFQDKVENQDSTGKQNEIETVKYACKIQQNCPIDVSSRDGNCKFYTYRNSQKHESTLLHVCTELIFDSRPFMHRKIFLKKLLQKLVADNLRFFWHLLRPHQSIIRGTVSL